MCFVFDDYDWTAEVFTEKDVSLLIPAKCNECYRRIAPGGMIHHIHLQEYECCRLCDSETRDRWDSDWNGEDLAPCQGEHDYGETDDYYQCQDCRRLLEAIKDVELQAGCRASESQPPLGMLLECLQEMDREDTLRYFRKAEEKYPELVMNGYLGWMKDRLSR